jgi:lysophospholipase
LSDAPYLAGPPDAPEGGRAVWLRAADGVRIRAVYWPRGTRGTVVMLPGRTEHAEKYVCAAAGFAAHGYAAAAIDWRGQGLADRALRDRLKGHVGDFAEYQRDLDAFLAGIAAAGLPRPWFLLGHSMGGAIGLRALVRGLPFAAAVFSAPMWGIVVPGGRTGLVTRAARAIASLGLADRYVPPPLATGPVCYAASAPFEGNTLTSDAEGFAWMKAQLVATPDLQVGGPTFGWLAAALAECRALAGLPSPSVPCLTTLGTRERVVDQAAVRARMARWPGGRLLAIEGAEHEVLMERPAIRDGFVEAAAAHLAAAAARTDPRTK